MGNRGIFTKVMAGVLMVTILFGCAGAQPAPSAAPTLPLPSESGEIEKESSAASGETDVSERETEGSAVDDAAGEKPIPSFSEHLEELGVELPPEMIKAVEENTEFSPEVLALLPFNTEQSEDYPEDGIEILEHSNFKILHIGFSQVYGGINEYYVFDDNQYSGMFEIERPIYVDERFEQYKDRVWMIVDVYDGHGMGGPAFSKQRQVWFEISHPDHVVSLTFTSRLNGTWIYPEPETYYEAEVVDVSTEKVEDTERFLVTLQWTETLRPGMLRDPSDMDTDFELFSEQGAVQYVYSYDNNYFYKASDGILIGNNIFSASEDSELREVTNDIYNENDTMYGRDTYNLLFTYKDRMLEMAETGSEDQKRWLRDFLASFEGLDEIDELYRWSQK